MCSFAPVHGVRLYVMIDKAIELVVNDAHVEKMDKASKDAEHLEAASKMVDWVHEQQRVDEEQDKRIVKLSIKSCRRRVIKQARFRRRWKDHRRHARLGRRHRDEASDEACREAHSVEEKAAASAAQRGGGGDSDELVKRAAAHECGMVRPPTAATVSWRRPKPVQSPVTQKRAYVRAPYNKRDGAFQVQWM
jgi:hypothetical protein